MFMILEDPLAFDEPQAVQKRDPAPKPRTTPSTSRPQPPADPSPQFAVSEGAERHFGFWLVVLGIVAILALVALVGFSPH
jgi:hypothetical protein